MSTVRRVYIYLIAFVSVIMAASGLAGLGRWLIVPLLSEDVARYGAFVVVGLPVWLLHWWLAQRSVRNSQVERSSTLRRLYVYAVLAVMLANGANAAWHSINAALASLTLGVLVPSYDAALLGLPWLVVAAIAWLYHRHVVCVDRRLAGEEGASATIRRWYVYGAATVGLVMMLAFGAGTLRLAWQQALALPSDVIDWGASRSLVQSCTSLIVGLLLWVAHWGWGASVAGARRSDDGRSTLRFLYVFLALAISVATALTGASQLLFYGLARGLGVPNPGGFGDAAQVALAGPISLLLVFGAAWLYHRHALRIEAASEAETARQAAIRRLYVHLVCLVTLVFAAVGAGGLLWTAADALTGAPRASATWWQHDLSLYVTAVVVALPVWVLHWRPSPHNLDERRSLARRLYVYLALITGVLALVGSVAAAVYQLLRLALGGSPSLTVTDLGRDLAVALVAAAAVAYHLLVLQRDARAIKSAGGGQPELASVATAGQLTCPACGQASADRAKFCWNCGARLRFDMGLALG